MIVLACDPGLSGAFCVIEDGEIVAMRDTPYVTKKIGRNDRRVIDEDSVIRIVRSYANKYDPHVFVIEQVGGIPGQSAPAAFSFGYGVGVATTAARCSTLSVLKVSPGSWKGALKVPADKNGARAKATEYFPKDAYLWPLVKHDGRAEAALIGLYGTMLFAQDGVHELFGGANVN